MSPTLTATPVTRSAATQATTMKAIVQDRYGSPTARAGETVRARTWHTSVAG